MSSIPRNPIPETVNLHLWPYCNLRCTYCYGRFPARPAALPPEDWQQILGTLRDVGVHRVNFSGGEPTLYPRLALVVEHARELGLQTSIITNGARLPDGLLRRFDLLGLSIDSADDAISARLGRYDRTLPSYREHIESLTVRARRLGVPVKLNTVVTALNCDEDLRPLYRRLRPAKVKLLEFTEVRGENDHNAATLRVTPEQFQSFARRHLSLRAEGLWIEPEPASTIASTYVMVDPSGRVFQHASGGHRVSRPLTEVGLLEAMASVGGYDRVGFEGRGGHVDVRRLPVLHREVG